jgi:N-acetylglucosaminyl-diphospho-decaprenol L-rhamnosyltransferase
MAGDMALSVVIVTHDSAGHIGEVLMALAPQLAGDDEVILVDNASADDTVAIAIGALPAVQVRETGANLGFSPACNIGVARSSGALILLLNPDCVPQPGCLAALRATGAERPGWGAWQAVVLLEDGTRVNTAGNVVHFLGISWAGGLEEPLAALPPAPHSVAFGSGAALVVRREAWAQAGGFEDRFFMYCEDLDLCLRLRLLGWDIGVTPAARVLHDYAFAKGGYKWFYLERNRWWTVLGTYPRPLLLAVLPALLAFEVVLLPAAARGGWLGPKLRAQMAVLTELRAILARRRRIQRERRITPAAFAATLVASLDSPMLAPARAIPGARRVLALYWRVVTRALR